MYGATAWGLGVSFSNPYYVAGALPTFDYSQPIVVNTFNVSADAEGEAASQPVVPEESPEVAQAFQAFDDARQAFSHGDFARALTLTEQAIVAIPNDPVLHEFAALSLFATGDFGRAAIILNSLLAAAPGMDWTTMSGLYSNIDDYTQQLRKLEEFTELNPTDSAARFVLAYHYLVLGHKDAAIVELKAVVENQPSDRVAQRLLDALLPVEEPEAAELSLEIAPAEVAAPAEAPAEESPATDLVGLWRAERAEGDIFELKVDEESTFVWKVTPKNGAVVELSGPLGAEYDTLILESADQGTLVAKVKSLGPDAFQFILPGGPPDDEGVTFRRVPAD